MKQFSYFLFAWLWLGSSVWAQSPSATLDALLAAHGVTSTVQQTQVRLQGQYVRVRRGQSTELPLVVKTRGYDEVRFEIEEPSGLNVSVQSGGFRWSRKGSEQARGYDGRVSLNLPFMDSPSTGLLPYLFANRTRITSLQEGSGTLDGRAVMLLQLTVPDGNASRARLGTHFDRKFELVLDGTSHRLLAASFVPDSDSPGEKENYRFEDYTLHGGLLFPAKVTRSTGWFGGASRGQVLSILKFDTISLLENFPDTDFRRP
jgi:hypothetical protein